MEDEEGMLVPVLGILRHYPLKYSVVSDPDGKVVGASSLGHDTEQ